MVQVCGAPDDQELPPNFMKLAKDVYTPDVMAASDCMLGELKYVFFSFSFLSHSPLLIRDMMSFHEKSDIELVVKPWHTNYLLCLCRELFQ